MPPPIRTIAFVDGFNLYHALDGLRANHLKWLDLRAMLRNFALPPLFSLDRILYFSALASWLPDHAGRHEAYVRALQATGVEPIMGKFKQKERECKKCGNTWISHEEKETDVSIAIFLLDLAQRDQFDRALLVTADSDLCPAARMVLERFPAKEIKVITPPGRWSSRELETATGRDATKIRPIHIVRSLLPAQVVDASGTVVAVRPSQYDPPSPTSSSLCPES